MKTLVRIGVVVAAAALALTGCGQPTETQESATSGESQSAIDVTAAETKACLVSDEAGFEDKGLNQLSRAGLERAEKELEVAIATVTPVSTAEYELSIQQMVAEDCTLIFGTGDLMVKAMQSQAEEHPEVDFALIDATFPKSPSNTRALLFNTAEASFLAGYVAAAMTPTGKIGLLLATKDTSSVRVADGFAGGINEYNEAHGKAIELLGWADPQKDDLVLDKLDETTAQKVSTDLIAAGAGIIMPVIGADGKETLQAAKNNGETWVIWVGTDGAITYPDYANSILTSVVKRSDSAVFDTVRAVRDAKFDSAPYVGNLENGGVELAPWHDYDALIPPQVKEEIDQLREQLISGKVTVETKDAEG